MRYPKLTINHNHGLLIMRDVEVDAQGIARGTVVAGGITNRLFHATNFQPFPVGEQKSWPLYGRKPYEYHVGGVVDGEWQNTPTPGNYHVDCCWCG